MEKRKPFASRIFRYTLLDCKDELDEKYETCYQNLVQCIQGKGEREVSDSLMQEVTKNHNNLCIGLLVGILSEPNDCARFYSYLNFVASDGLCCVVNELNRLLLEKMPKLQETCQDQLLWLVREMVRSGLPGVDSLCWNCLRNLSGGDISTKNLSIADKVLNIFIENRGWLESQPQLVAGVVFTFLRLVEDHVSPNLKMFREKEVSFLVGLIRKRFDDVITIGRDFIRVLQNVAKIEEFESIWQDFIYDPESLSPNFSGLEQLMKIPTPSKFLTLLVTPEIERKLLFLTQNVKFGHHTRYENWFRGCYLRAPESQSRRADLVRFLVSVIHPSNELLSSDVVPRWAVVGGFLTSCTNQVTSANVKLALFYDWLFFDPSQDNIMNIEPAALVMRHSLMPHPQITATLLDCLCRLAHQFHPLSTALILASITEALRTLVIKGVLPSLSPLLFNKCLNASLRQMLVKSFRDIYNEENGNVERPPIVNGIGPNLSAEFSDSDENSEEEVEDVEAGLKDSASGSGLTVSVSPSDQLDILMAKVKELESLVDQQCQSKVLGQVVQMVLREPVYGEESRLLADSLSTHLAQHFEGKFSDELSCNMSDSPVVFSLFDCLSDPRREPLLELLTNLHFNQPKLGYYLLAFLFSNQCKWSVEEKTAAYQEFCRTRESEASLSSSLVQDLTSCQNEDVDLFLRLADHLYRQLPEITLGSVGLMYLLVSCVDGPQIQSLVCQVVSQQLCLLRHDSAQPILTASLGWETFEQFAFWQLYNAHELPLGTILQFLPSLQGVNTQAEALTNVMLILKKKQPNPDILHQLILRRPLEGDLLLSSMFSFWMQYCKDKLADTFVSFINKSLPRDGAKKRNNDGTGQDKVLVSNILVHSSQLIKTCPDLFLRPPVHEIFIKLKQSCAEKTRFVHSSFFSDLEMLNQKSRDEDLQHSSSDSSPPLNPPKKRRRRISGGVNYREDTSSESEGEVVAVAAVASRKRKLGNA